MLSSVLSWVMTNSIYGIGGIAVVIYVFLSALKKKFPKLPEPAYIAVPVFLIGLFTLPSLPRYQFEYDVMSKMEGKDWIRVVNKTEWGSLTEPLTWVKTPVGSVTVVMPNSPIEGGFREVLLRYEEKEVISMVEPDCNNLTILYAQSDKEGVFRYTTNSSVEMRDEQKKWYCEYDWSKEKEALRREVLRQASETIKKE